MNFAGLALRKSFFQDPITATLSYSDIFRGQIYSGYQQAGTLNRYFSNVQDTRRIALGVIINIGKKTVKNIEQHQLGNNDLIKRTN